MPVKWKNAKDQAKYHAPLKPPVEITKTGVKTFGEILKEVQALKKAENAAKKDIFAEVYGATKVKFLDPDLSMKDFSTDLYHGKTGFVSPSMPTFKKPDPGKVPCLEFLKQAGVSVNTLKGLTTPPVTCNYFVDGGNIHLFVQCGGKSKTLKMFWGGTPSGFQAALKNPATNLFPFKWGAEIDDFYHNVISPMVADVMFGMKSYADEPLEPVPEKTKVLGKSPVEFVLPPDYGKIYEDEEKDVGGKTVFGVLPALDPGKTVPELPVVNKGTDAKAWPVFDQDKMATAPRVKLREATMLYQPVFGTDENSRYFVVGGNKNVRIAARIKGAKLSVRIESPDLSKYVGLLEEAGFSVSHGNGTHASVHLDVGHGIIMVRRALGAILIGSGLVLDSPIPNADVVRKASNA